MPITKWPKNISISSQFSYEFDSIELHSCWLFKDFSLTFNLLLTFYWLFIIFSWHFIDFLSTSRLFFVNFYLLFIYFLLHNAEGFWWQAYRQTVEILDIWLKKVAWTDERTPRQVFLASEKICILERRIFSLCQDEQQTAQV